GRAIGFLYGSNTLGAGGGAVLGEGYLIAAFGLRGTSSAAALASCSAAAVALLITQVDRNTPARVPERIVPLRLGAKYCPPWRMLFISFGTGCILLSLEVIWFRFLRLYVVSPPTAFPIRRAIVLAGIGLGGIAAGIILCRSARSNHLLPVLLLLTAIAVLLSYLFF